MKEDDEILKKFGAGNCFTVPDGYFDNLTAEVMNKLPEKETKLQIKRQNTVWQRVRPWLYMAAVFSGLLIGIRFMVTNTTKSEKTTIATVDLKGTDIPDEYIETAIDHSMMDDYSLYQYLTEADSETIQ
jgi:hypothetical protein